MSSSSPPTNSTQDLKYPPVRVNHSLTKLDLDTLMMRSTTRRLPEEAGSSLDDSTYELLGDSLLETSDDEAQTESIASTDGPTPDDASDFSDDDDLYEADGKDMHANAHSSHAEAHEQQSDVHTMTTGEDSTLTEVPPHMQGSESSRRIRLEEQPAEEYDAVIGTKVIKSLPDETSELPQVLNRYGCSQVRLVVRAALSPRPLPTTDTYRVLYIGMPEKWLEDVVTSQIGATLAASPSVSRSVMVRGGQIEPYGPVIHVYRCVELRTFAEHDKRSHVLIILDDGRQLKLGPGLASPSEGRPDLVVFCHPTIPGAVTTDVQEFASASEVFGREKIPCINLAQARPYGNGAPAYDSKSLRVCVEGRDDSESDYELKEVLPLDYYTFSELEPYQLNRHLAFISPHLFPEPDTSMYTPRRSFIGDKYDALMKKYGRQWPLLKIFISFMVLFALIPALLQGAAYAPLLLQRSSNIDLQSSVSAQSSVVPSSVTSTVLTSQTGVPVSFMPSVRSVVGDLTLVPLQAKPPKRKSEKKDEKIREFEIQATGDHQFVLSPSKGFVNVRRTPQLQIQVSRESKPVSVRYNRTISGEYIVDLEHEYYNGTFHVSIATLSKPLLRQSFEMTLGHNKSALTRLLDTAKLNLDRKRSNMKTASSILVHHFREGLAEVEAAAYGPSEEALKCLQNAKEAVQQKLATSTKFLTQAPEAAWLNLRVASAPVRTSSPMLRARMNALRLRCKVEIATGLSGDGLSEKQSWACSKVRAEA